MTVLDDVYEAILKYPSTYVTIEIIDVNWPGDALNDDDDTEFRFRAVNRGPLDMTEPTFKVEGVNGTLVRSSGAGAQYVSSFTTGPGFFPDLGAHQDTNFVTWTSRAFWFKPTRVSTTERELVRVSVAGWASSWDHNFDNHTVADEDAKASYISAVAVE